MAPPYVILRCAMSVDGRIDDVSTQRLILSNDEEFDAVDALRAECDAILVGAETVRRDRPRLVLRSAERRAARMARGLPGDPIKVTLTRTGRLDPGHEFFTLGDAEKLVYCPVTIESELRVRLGDAATVVALAVRGESRSGPGASALSVAETQPGAAVPRFHHEVPVNDPSGLGFVLRDLGRRGIRRLLVEGGSAINTQFLAHGCVDELHVAVAPFFVGQADAPPLIHAGTFPHDADHRMTLLGVDSLGDVVVLRYRLVRFDGPEHTDDATTALAAPTLTPALSLEGRGGDMPADGDRAGLKRAIELSRRCPPSDGAFSVGAVIVDAGGREIGNGFSRETGPDVHAEEVAIDRAVRSGADAAHCTLYSSMEPCGRRLSGKPSCAERVVSSGIRRVVYALPEPPVFVKGTGRAKLESAGVAVEVIEDFAAEVRAINRHLLKST